MLRLFSFLDPNRYFVNPHSFPPLAVGVLVGLLGFLVFLVERRSREGVAFWRLTSVGGIWLVACSCIFASSDPLVALFWIKVELTAVVFIPSLFYYVAVLLTQRYEYHRISVRIFFYTSAFFLLLLIVTDNFVSGVSRYFWGYYARFGFVGAAFCLFFLIAMGASLVLYANAFRRATRKRHRHRYAAFLIAFGLGCFGSIDFFAVFGLGVYPAGYIAVILFVLASAWAFYKYQFSDITPSFAAEKIIENMSDSLIVFDWEGVVRVANPAAAQLLNVSTRDLIGTSVSSMKPVFLTRWQFDRVLSDHAPETFEVQLSEKRTIRVSITVMKDQWAEPVAVVCIMKDVTNEKEAEETHRQLVSIVDSLEEAIISLTPEGRVTTWNAGAQTIYGYFAEEMKGRLITDLVSPDDQKEFEELLNRPRQGSYVLNCEIVHRHKSGTQILVSLTLSPVIGEGGKVIGISFIARKLTQRSSQKF